MLVKVILPTGEPVEYEYDGNQRLISRKSSDRVDNFVQSGWDIMTKTDDLGKRTYYTGSSAIEDRESVKYFHYNHRGDTVLVTDADGEIIHNLNYEAYGKPTNNEGIPINTLSLSNITAPNPGSNTTSDSGGNNLPNLFVGASGIKYDTKTNLHYMRFRWFSASQLRFISPDLLMDLNRYAYVSGNPVRFIDPLGLQQSPDPYTRWFTNPYEYKVNVIDKAPKFADTLFEGLWNFTSAFVSSFLNNPYKTKFTPNTDNLYRNFKAYDRALIPIEKIRKISAFSISAVITFPTIIPNTYIGGGCEVLFIGKKSRYYAFPILAFGTGPANSVSINFYRGLYSFDQFPGLYTSITLSPGFLEGGMGAAIKDVDSLSLGIVALDYGASLDLKYYVDVTDIVNSYFDKYRNFWNGE